MTNLHEILEKARAARQRLPTNEAAVLFAAAVRLAAAQGATLRARLVQIDDSGGLHIAAFDDHAPETEPGYLAPELMGPEAPRKSEPRVQVYAAGALGFELLTGHVPPGNPNELNNPLADTIRMALAPDRRERFGDLNQLLDAIEAVQARPPAEGERNIFAALRGRFARPPPEKEALARLIEKLGSLEVLVAQLSRAQAKLDAAQRQSLEWIDRFEQGQQRLKGPKPSTLGPALLAAVLAAAGVIAGGWALGMISAPGRGALRNEPAAAEEKTPLAAADAAVALEKSAPPPEKSAPPPEKSAPPSDKSAGAAGKASEAAEKPSEAETATAASADLDAGASAATDAGATALAVAAPDAGTAAVSPPPPRRRRQPEVSQAAMLHAVAVSQVRRGESALEQGRSDEALASFRAALENEAALAVAFRGMGMAYAMQGNDAQALQAYEKYLRLAPAAPDKGDIRRSIAELKARARIGAGDK